MSSLLITFLNENKFSSFPILYSLIILLLLLGKKLDEQQPEAGQRRNKERKYYCENLNYYSLTLYFLSKELFIILKAFYRLPMICFIYTSAYFSVWWWWLMSTWSIRNKREIIKLKEIEKFLFMLIELERKIAKNHWHIVLYTTDTIVNKDTLQTKG